MPDTWQPEVDEIRRRERLALAAFKARAKGDVSDQL